MKTFSMCAVGLFLLLSALVGADGADDRALAADSDGIAGFNGLLGDRGLSKLSDFGLNESKKYVKEVDSQTERMVSERAVGLMTALKLGDYEAVRRQMLPEVAAVFSTNDLARIFARARGASGKIDVVEEIKIDFSFVPIRYHSGADSSKKPAFVWNARERYRLCVVWVSLIGNRHWSGLIDDLIAPSFRRALSSGRKPGPQWSTKHIYCAEDISKHMNGTRDLGIMYWVLKPDISATQTLPATFLYGIRSRYRDLFPQKDPWSDIKPPQWHEVMNTDTDPGPGYTF